MNWLNIELAALRSPEFLGCEPVERSTWLCLLAYCADQENGGRIAGARRWGARKWPQLTGTFAEEVGRECPLWAWDGDDLVVWRYPVETEAAIQAKREAGKRYGRGHPKAAGDSSPAKHADSSPISSALTERNRKEKKEDGFAIAHPSTARAGAREMGGCSQPDNVPSVVIPDPGEFSAIMERAGVPNDFAESWYDEARGAGGYDRRNRRIHDWPAACRAAWVNSRRVETNKPKRTRYA